MNYTDLEPISFVGTVLQCPQANAGLQTDRPDVVRTGHDYAAVVNVSTVAGNWQVVFVGLDALTVAQHQPLTVGDIIAVGGRITFVGDLCAQWFSSQDVHRIEDVKASLYALGLTDRSTVIRTEEVFVKEAFSVIDF